MSLGPSEHSVQTMPSRIPCRPHPNLNVENPSLLAITGNAVGTVFGVVSFGAAFVSYLASILIVVSLLFHVYILHFRLLIDQAHHPAHLQHQNPNSAPDQAINAEPPPDQTVYPYSIESNDIHSETYHNVEPSESRNHLETSHHVSKPTWVFWAVFSVNFTMACSYALLSLLVSSLPPKPSTTIGEILSYVYVLST